MKKLRVLARFRDERNFFSIHQEGDMVVVTPDRAARLVAMGLCEEVEEVKADGGDTFEQTDDTSAVAEKPKRNYRKKKEA